MPTKPLTTKQKGTVIAAVLAACSILLGGGIALPDKDDGLEKRVERLERSQAVDSTNIESIKEDTRYIRQKMDAFIDNTRTK